MAGLRSGSDGGAAVALFAAPSADAHKCTITNELCSIRMVRTKRCHRLTGPPLAPPPSARAQVHQLAAHRPASSARVEVCQLDVHRPAHGVT